MKTEVLSASDPNALRYAADVLRYGGLVAFPTDTVYGVGALAFHQEAVPRLYTVKGRATEKAIAVLVGRASDLDAVAGDFSQARTAGRGKFWPGSLTLVVPKIPTLPEDISALPTVGVRMPDLDLARRAAAAGWPDGGDQRQPFGRAQRADRRTGRWSSSPAASS